MKFPQPASRFALVGVFVAQAAGKENEGVRVAVTGAASHVHRAKSIEDALGKSFTADAAKLGDHDLLRNFAALVVPRGEPVPSRGHALDRERSVGR